MRASPWPAVRLVARREVATKVRSRSFLISTALFLIGIVGGGILYDVLGGSEPERIGVTAEAGDLRGEVEAVADGLGTDVTVTEVAGYDAGVARVRDEELDALVGVTGDGTVTAVVPDEPGTEQEALLAALSQQRALARAAQELGGEPGDLADAMAGAAPEVRVLEEQDTDGGQVFAGFAVGILLFIGLMSSGQMVAMGVVEEKSSRVVELLLATLRPWQLMSGKVLGIGVVGLLQVGLIVVAAAGTALALDLVGSSGLSVGATAVWALVWFVLGYLVYALVMAALAALVSRQEDVGAVLSPVVTVMMIPYGVGVSLAPQDPDHLLVVVLSLVPFTAPLMMPIRIALGQVASWEVWLSLGLSVALVPVLVWLAGRIYSGAVLHTGGRMRLRQAIGADS